MRVEVIMPKLGIYDGEVSLIEWLVASGSEVDIGDPLFLMETDKVETEIEADDPGILVHTAESGLTAPVGTRIGWLVSTWPEYEAIRSEETPT